jgi:hypothetical protein
MKSAGVPASRYEGYFYPNEGHDTVRINGPAIIRKFISRHLNVKEIKAAARSVFLPLP